MLYSIFDIQTAMRLLKTSNAARIDYDSVLIVFAPLLKPLTREAFTSHPIRTLKF